MPTSLSLSVCVCVYPSPSPLSPPFGTRYALAATVYDYMTGEGSPPSQIRLTVCRLLVQMSKLDSQIAVMIMSERWGEIVNSCFVYYVYHTYVS